MYLRILRAQFRNWQALLLLGAFIAMLVGHALFNAFAGLEMYWAPMVYALLVYGSVINASPRIPFGLTRGQAIKSNLIAAAPIVALSFAFARGKGLWWAVGSALVILAMAFAYVFARDSQDNRKYVGGYRSTALSRPGSVERVFIYRPMIPLGFLAGVAFGTSLIIYLATDGAMWSYLLTVLCIYALCCGPMVVLGASDTGGIWFSIGLGRAQWIRHTVRAVALATLCSFVGTAIVLGIVAPEMLSANWAWLFALFLTTGVIAASCVVFLTAFPSWGMGIAMALVIMFGNNAMILGFFGEGDLGEALILYGVHAVVALIPGILVARSLLKGAKGRIVSAAMNQAKQGE